MNPPVRPLKTELSEALVSGIRQRGPEAFGSMLMALTRIVTSGMVLALMLIASWAFDYDVTVGPFAGMTTISGLVSWLLTRDRRWGEDVDRNESQGADEAPDSG
jgi:hypothetical protein